MDVKPSRTTNTYAPDRLLVGAAPRTQDETILTGQNVARGELVGKVTASGKLIASLSGAVDGSEVPFGIMAEAIDATAADKAGVVYVSGDFNEDAITFGTAHTAASTRDGLRALGIHLHDPVEA